MWLNLNTLDIIMEVAQGLKNKTTQTLVEQI